MSLRPHAVLDGACIVWRWRTEPAIDCKGLEDDTLGVRESTRVNTVSNKFHRDLSRSVIDDMST